MHRTHKTMVLRLAALALAFACDAAAQVRGVKGWVAEQVVRPDVQCWAVVVGVSDYRHDTAFLPDLGYAAADAQAFADMLRSGSAGRFPEDHVRALIDRDATSRNVRRALSDFLAPRAGPNDLVIIYFAGHGAADPRCPGRYYLLTRDTDANNMFATAVAMGELREILTEDVAAKRVVLISDCCHSGAVGWSRSAGVNASNEYLRRLSDTKAGLCILTASRAGELSQETPEFKHGVFTYYLLQGIRERLADANQDGFVTVSEAQDFVLDRVRKQTKGAQHPSLYGDGDFDLPLGAPGVSPAQAAPAGAIAVVCDVAGAEIRVDGEVVGKTAASCAWIIRRLSPGLHRLRVAKAGHASFKQTCRVQADQPLQVVAHLPTKRQLEVDAARAAQALARLRSDCRFYLRSMEFGLALGACDDLLADESFAGIRREVEAERRDAQMVQFLWRNAVQHAAVLKGEELNVQAYTPSGGRMRAKATVSDVQGERVFLRMGAKREEISLRQIDLDVLLMLAKAGLPDSDALLHVACGLLCLSREQPSAALAEFAKAEKLGAPVARYRQKVEESLRK